MEKIIQLTFLPLGLHIGSQLQRGTARQGIKDTTNRLITLRLFMYTYVYTYIRALTI